MEITGTITLTMNERTGQKQDGSTWKTMDFLLEVTPKNQFEANNPQMVVFTVSDGLNNRCERVKKMLGLECKVWYNFAASEYNGRWFNNIRATEIRELAVLNQQTQQQ